MVFAMPPAPGDEPAAARRSVSLFGSGGAEGAAVDWRESGQAARHSGSATYELLDMSSLTPTPDPSLNLDALRLRLSGAGGDRFWRSLEEAAETPEFRELLAREFAVPLPA